jgi:uncharacterized protein (DUF1684 family)
MRPGTLPRILYFFIISAIPCHLAADDSYRQSVEKWRQNYQASLTSDSGWLTVSGLFWLKEGDNTFGSAEGNDIVLPSSAPASVGSFALHAGKTTVHVHPDAPVTRNGQPVLNAELKPDSREDYLLLGDLTLYVHLSGNRFSIRVKDKNSSLRKNFMGLNWYPVDESYAVKGTYIPYESPKAIDSQNVLGDAIKMSLIGYVEFSFRGMEFRLEAGTEDSGKTLFIVFRDLTSGKDTYPASRFLKVEAPPAGTQNGSVLLDFNEAYNPPCAYNPYTTCPLPLPGNRLKIAIPAGEKLYRHSHEN